MANRCGKITFPAFFHASFNPKKHVNRKDAKNAKENPSVLLPESFT